MQAAVFKAEGGCVAKTERAKWREVMRRTHVRQKLEFNEAMGHSCGTVVRCAQGGDGGWVRGLGELYMYIQIHALAAGSWLKPRSIIRASVRRSWLRGGAKR